MSSAIAIIHVFLWQTTVVDNGEFALLEKTFNHLGI